MYMDYAWNKRLWKVCALSFEPSFVFAYLLSLSGADPGFRGEGGQSERGRIYGVASK